MKPFLVIIVILFFITMVGVLFLLESYITASL